MTPSESEGTEPTHASVTVRPETGVPPTRADVWVEFLALSELAGPIIVMYFFSIGVAFISQVLVGHVSSTHLAAAALATMFANATGLSLVLGCAASCDTLCSQAFGAGNYARVGMVAYRGVFVGLVMSLFVGALWLLGAAPFFRAMGQDEALIALATEYIKCLLVGLPAQVSFELLKKPFLCANMTAQPLFFSALSMALAGVMGYAAVYGSGDGFYLGAPLAASLSYWLCLALLLAYTRWHRGAHRALGALLRPCGGGRAAATAAAADDDDGGAGAAEWGVAPWAPEPRCGDAAARRRGSCGTEAPAAALLPAAAAPAPPPPPPPPPPFHELLDALWPAPTAAGVLSPPGLLEYVRMGVPSAAMLFVEWGSYEVLAVFAGLLGQVELASHSILALTASISFMPFLGFSVACCIRVGHALGELQPRGALLSYRTSLLCALLVFCANGAVMMAARRGWGAVFTGDTIVGGVVADTLPLVALYGLFDGLQCVATGALRGAALQATAAGINLFSYTAVGLPLAFALAIKAGWGLSGIWAAFNVAVLTSFMLAAAALARTNWAEKAELAHKKALQ